MSRFAGVSTAVGKFKMAPKFIQKLEDLIRISIHSDRTLGHFYDEEAREKLYFNGTV
jgi:hypothetical protein